MPSGLRYHSAGQIPVMQDIYSGEVDYMSLSWVNRLSGEAISASGVSAFLNWYIPAGMTAYNSGTASGASAMWMVFSATAPPNTVLRLSARILTTSGKSLFEYFDCRIWTGQS